MSERAVDPAGSRAHDRDGRCALHPASRSIETCRRCGAFACEVCWRAADALCATCVAANHGTTAVAWESGGHIGLLKTVRDAWLRPAHFFGRLPDGPIWRPFVFACVVWFAFFFVAILWSFAFPLEFLADSPTADLSSLPASLAALVLAIVVITTLAVVSLHAIARSLGGQAGLRVSLRAALYLHAFLPALFLQLPLVSALSEPRLAFPGSMTVLLGLGARGAYFFARGRHQLEPARAAMVALVPAAALGGSVFSLWWLLNAV